MIFFSTELPVSTSGLVSPIEVSNVKASTSLDSTVSTPLTLCPPATPSEVIFYDSNSGKFK